jgi:outer membrane protein assembly factor BamB
MFTRKEVFHINGNDKDSRRKWGAFDSNALIEKNSGNVFWPGENGMLYNFTLDEDRKLKKMKKMRYQHSQLFRQGIESSLAAIGQYGFFLDNSGSLVCVDLNKLKPIWNVSNFDDSDATTMIDKENKDYFLYTGHEVDKLAPAHEVFFRKIAAKDGKEIWRVSRKCFGGKIKDKTIDGGILASPVLGKNKGNHLVFTVFSRIDKKDKAEIVAINKITGKEEWSIILDKFSWSSPVDFYDADGNIYLFFTDVTGNIYIVNGTDGKLILKERSEYTFESSPIIIDDKVYIASRGRSILCYNILTD